MRTHGAGGARRQRCALRRALLVALVATATTAQQRVARGESRYVVVHLQPATMYSELDDTRHANWTVAEQPSARDAACSPFDAASHWRANVTLDAPASGASFSNALVMANFADVVVHNASAAPNATLFDKVDLMSTLRSGAATVLGAEMSVVGAYTRKVGSNAMQDARAVFRARPAGTPLGSDARAESDDMGKFDAWSGSYDPPHVHGSSNGTFGFDDRAWRTALVTNTLEYLLYVRSGANTQYDAVVACAQLRLYVRVDYALHALPPPPPPPPPSFMPTTVAAAQTTVPPGASTAQQQVPSGVATTAAPASSAATAATRTTIAPVATPSQPQSATPPSPPPAWWTSTNASPPSTKATTSPLAVPSADVGGTGGARQQADGLAGSEWATVAGAGAVGALAATLVCALVAATMCFAFYMHLRRVKGERGGSGDGRGDEPRSRWRHQSIGTDMDLATRTLPVIDLERRDGALRLCEPSKGRSPSSLPPPRAAKCEQACVRSALDGDDAQREQNPPPRAAAAAAGYESATDALRGARKSPYNSGQSVPRTSQYASVKPATTRGAAGARYDRVEDALFDCSATDGAAAADYESASSALQGANRAGGDSGQAPLVIQYSQLPT